MPITFVFIIFFPAVLILISICFSSELLCFAGKSKAYIMGRSGRGLLCIFVLDNPKEFICRLRSKVCLISCSGNDLYLLFQRKKKQESMLIRFPGFYLLWYPTTWSNLAALKYCKSYGTYLEENQLHKMQNLVTWGRYCHTTAFT